MAERKYESFAIIPDNLTGIERYVDAQISLYRQLLQLIGSQTSLGDMPKFLGNKDNLLLGMARLGRRCIYSYVLIEEQKAIGDNELNI